MKDYSVELAGSDTVQLKKYLVKHEIKFESSGCWNLTHFSILCDETTAKRISDFLEELLCE